MDSNNELTFIQRLRCEQFSTLINHIQGKSSIEIPDDIINEIKSHINTSKEYNFKNIFLETSKIIRHSPQLYKYNDDSYIIVARILNYKLKPLLLEDEINIKNKFLDIVKVWSELKIKERSFLSYNYILYKLLEMHHCYDIIELNKLENIKLTSKLIIHDEIWEKISEHLGWKCSKKRQRDDNS